MKRERAAAEADGRGDRDDAAPGPAATKRRRLVSGADVGLPRYATLVEEVDDVEEVHTVLVRFPCFDYFRNVHLCEGRSVAPPKAATAVVGRKSPTSAAAGRWDSVAGSSSGGTVLATSQPPKPAPESAFVPGAVSFVADTLETDTPVLLVNAGTPRKMRFTGQWCEVAGNGVAASNRAILHVAPKPGTDAGGGTDSSTGVDALRPATEDGGVGASPSQGSAGTSQPIPSLFPHAVSGVTADEKRHQQAELRKGWVYDRIDVPSAVLVMHRAS